MTDAGHNNPPAEATFALHVDDLFDLLSSSIGGGVTDDQQECDIDGIMDEFRKASQGADAARKKEAKPFDDGKKAVQAKWKPIIDKAERGAIACKEALTPYRQARQRAKEEAARKAREEAEERERQAREALQSSDDLETKFEAEQQLEAAKKLSAVANKIDRAPTGLRTFWEAEITDRDAALRFYLTHNPEAFIALIQQLADQDARGARPQRPGITYHERKKAA